MEEEAQPRQQDKIIVRSNKEYQAKHAIKAMAIYAKLKASHPDDIKALRSRSMSISDIGEDVPAPNSLQKPEKRKQRW